MNMNTLKLGNCQGRSFIFSCSHLQPLCTKMYHLFFVVIFSHFQPDISTVLILCCNVSILDIYPTVTSRTNGNRFRFFTQS